MAFKLVVFMVVAVAAGGAAGLARSDSEAGREFRAQLANVLSPGTLIAIQARSQTFSTPIFEHERPDSLLQNFVIDGQQDATFSRCLDAGRPEEMEALASRHDHQATVGLVNCLLTHDRQRFCTASGRQLIATATELYLWSRDYYFNHRADLDQRYQIDKLNDPDEHPLTFDPYYKTWNGPEDHALIENLKSLARTGYINPVAFSQLPRYEIKQAMEGLTPDGDACAAQKT
jgi:hypothetical protein